MIKTRNLPLALIALALAAVVLPAMACSGQRANYVAETSSMAEPEKRLLIRSGDLALSVAEPTEILPEVESIILETGGFIEHSTREDASIWLRSRVPADSLDATLTKIAGLGKVTRRSVSASDVTDQHADLTARLETSRQLRTRLRELLDQSTSVTDLLAVETELARVQAEIESMETQLEGLDSQIQYSALSVRVETKRVFGPLGFVGYWAGWAVSKLFIIQ